METLIHADIFFFVTTIAVILLVILLAIALIYLIKILRNFSSISETLRKGVDHASSHVEELCNSILSNPIFKFFFGKKRPNKRSSKKD